MKESFLKKLLYEVLGSLLFLSVIFLLYLTWERTRDPLQALGALDLQPAIYERYCLF